MNYILFDRTDEPKLRPLSFTKPIADLRIGILTFRERWEKHLDASTSSATHDYLQEKYPLVLDNDNIFIDGSIVATPDLVEAVLDLAVDTALVHQGTLVAWRCSQLLAEKFAASPHNALSEGVFTEEFEGELFRIDQNWEFFTRNGAAIEIDWKLVTDGMSNQPSATNTILGDQVFIEEGATVECAVLNSTSGPIYIGKNATIMEGAVVRGPFALCEGATLKLSTKVYGPTTVGPYCKAGGEVSNSILMGYSNKGHDGFIGNTVIGEWCNLGADTNTSNLKNNYGNVRVWDYTTADQVNTGQTFLGLTMGDHSKCGINTMFNTGTVVGVNANIFGGGFPDKFIPSFGWGGADGFDTYDLLKSYGVAKTVCARRKVEFTEVDERIMKHIFHLTTPYRHWE